MNTSAIIYGIAGPELTPEEQALFAKVQPWGFILFARNMKSECQVRDLNASLMQSVEHNPHIFVDEEGGRVSRLRSIGGWTGPPAALFYNSGASIKACQSAILANYRAIGSRLSSLGFTANCAPVLDVPVRHADPIIGDRAFSQKAELVPMLAKACLQGLEDAGIAGVIKHIPGHGRADADSHLTLPVVTTGREELTRTDFAPFHAMRDAKMAMTAHVVYQDIDPKRPATTSPGVIEEVIRSEIGFDGLLMSDDLDMKALQGTHKERAINSLKAGCDMLLHCSGEMEAMRALAEVVPLLEGKALVRACRAAPLFESCKLDVQQVTAEATACLRAIGASV